MPRPRRIQIPGTYHVTGRGVLRSRIYADDVDRKRFLKLFAGVVKRYDLRCHAYCEMTNHYHLAITTSQANLSRALQYLNGRYAEWWNWRHGRTGHLFDARFRAQIVQDGHHLANVCRYIVLNPVRAGLVASPEQWEWSSYRANAGLIRPPHFLDCTQLARLMAPDDPAQGETRFREWVTGTDARRLRLSRGLILGDDAFVKRIAELRARTIDEAQCDARRPLAGIFDGVLTRAHRNAAIAVALEEHFTLTEIARYLAVDVSTVSKILSSQGARP